MQNYLRYIFHKDSTSTPTYEIYSELECLGDTHIVRELRLTMIIFLEYTVTSIINHENKRICPGIMIPTRWLLLLGANEVHALYD